MDTVGCLHRRRYTDACLSLCLTLMRTIRTALVFSSLLLVISCSGTTTGSGASSSVTSSVASQAPAVTRNVSFIGTVDQLGASIYMQGTHKLMLDDGRFIILESAGANLDLDTYIGKKAQVRGYSEPTVEAGGTLLHVEEIVSLESSFSSSEASKPKMCGGFAGFQCDNGQVCIDDPADSCDPQNGGADCSGICVVQLASSSSSVVSELVESSSSSSKAAVKSSSSSRQPVSSSSSSISSSVSSSVASANPDASKEQQIVAMMKLNYAADAMWTQRYCTTHISFCVPVHKQWYFQSFGAGAGSLWRVEFGFADITQANQGVIQLHLVSGSSASKGGVDGQVVTNGSTVTAYRDWTEDRHFELSGDARLKTAISYMIGHIDPYAGK